MTTCPNKMSNLREKGFSWLTVPGYSIQSWEVTTGGMGSKYFITRVEGGNAHTLSAQLDYLSSITQGLKPGCTTTSQHNSHHVPTSQPRQLVTKTSSQVILDSIKLTLKPAITRS